jgi:hypothetical protein
MAWTINSQRIYVQKISDGVKQIIAKLQPLSGGTVYQAFGYETNTLKLSAIVVGEANKNSIKDLTETGLSYELLSPEGDLGDFYVSSVNADRNNAVWQSITTSGDLTCTSPVYNVEIELYEDI